MDVAQIKIYVVTALFSDDKLLDRLILKGGSALELVYGIKHRRSIDVDLSLEGGLWGNSSDLEKIVKPLLHRNFREVGYEVFDFKCEQKPCVITDDLAEIWGGYTIDFKIIHLRKYDPDNIEKMRREAEVVGDNQTRTFKIDISAHEYGGGKKAYELDGYTINVYTPAMIVFEKIRAICQQMEEYRLIIKRPYHTARARDFIDIYTVMHDYEIDFKNPGNQALLLSIFKAKRVPPKLIRKISDYRELHRSDFDQVKSTITDNKNLKDYDYYFDFVIEQCRALESLWKEESPL